MPIPPAIVGGGLSLAGSLLGGIFQGGANRQNRRLAEYQWKKNLEMWHLQNAYNHPKQQMGRFKEAGLNPNLIYGQGSHGNATGSPQYQRPNIEPLASGDKIAQGGMNIYNAQVMSAQQKNIQQQTKVQRAEQLLKMVQIAVSGAKDPKTGKLLDVMIKEYQADAQLEAVNKTKQEIQNLKVTMDLLNKDMSLKQIQIEDAQIERDMKLIDKKWLDKNQLSRLDPTVTKIAHRIWKSGQAGVRSFQDAINMILSGALGRENILNFKN